MALVSWKTRSQRHDPDRSIRIAVSTRTNVLQLHSTEEVERPISNESRRKYYGKFPTMTNRPGQFDEDS